MLFIDNLDPASLEFLTKLVEKSGGDPSVGVSMYEIGTEMGLDKEGARHTAEDVIGRHLVEIISLSGSICLTETGLEAAEKLGLAVTAPQAGGSGEVVAASIAVPGTDRELRVLGPEAVEALRNLAAEMVKPGPGQETPEAEAAIDLAGLIAQLGSPRPKAGVVAELLLGLAAEIEEGEARTELIGWIKKLND
jgi:hypothetical protein